MRKPKRVIKDERFLMRISKNDKRNIVRLSKYFRTTQSKAILLLIRNYVLFNEIENLKQKAKQIY